MKIVSCPSCQTRVAPCLDGACPACRRPLPGFVSDSGCDDPEPEPSFGSGECEAAEPPGDQSFGQVEDVAQRIYESLKRGMLPRSCCTCQAAPTILGTIEIEHEEFSLGLPIRICARCARQPPFAPWRDPYPPIYFISLVLMTLLCVAGQFVLAITCFLAATLLIVCIRSSEDHSTGAALRRLRLQLRESPVYHELLTTFPDLAFSVIGKPFESAAGNGALAERFAESFQPYRMVYSLCSQTELQSSGVPLDVFTALVELVDREILAVLRDAQGLDGLWVQVSCAVLPGRRNAFEIQGLPYASLDELRNRLSALPSWPTAVPVVFVIQRRKHGTRTTEQPPIEPPLATWCDEVGADDKASAIEIACRFHQVAIADEPAGFTLEELESLRSLLPDSVDLALFHAHVLSYTGQHEQGLAIYDALVQRYPRDISLRRRCALGFEGADQLERAAAEYQSILRDFSENADILGHLAHLQLRMGRPQDALETATHALALEELPALFVVCAQSRFALEQYERAMSDCNRALFADANAADAYWLRARLYWMRENYSRTVADLEQVHRTAGKTVDSVDLMASTLRALGKPEEAVAVFDAALQDAPDHPLLKVRRAAFLADCGKLELALEDCDAVIDQFPDLEEAFATRAGIHLEGLRPEAALADAERAMELGLDNSRVVMMRGMAKASLGNLEEGRLDLTAAIEMDAENSLAYYHRARLQTLQEDLPDAIADWCAVVRLCPDWAEAHAQRGFLYLATDEIDDALQDFEAAIRQAPAMAEAYRGRAAVHQQRGRLDRAMADLNKAILLDPDNVASRLARSSLRLADNDADGARADLDAALLAAPDLDAALFQRGHLHLTQGDYEAARRDFDAILQQQPDAPMAILGRSVAWEQAGDFDRSALDAAEAAQAAAPYAEEIELARLLMNASVAHANEQYDKAIAYATEAIQQSPDCLVAYRYRAGAYWYSEQFVEALEDFTHLRDCLDEPDAGVLNGCGQVQAELGEFDEAVEDLTHAVDLARQEGSEAYLPYCLNGRGRALTGLGRYDEAERDFVESLRLKPDNAWLHYNRGLLLLARNEPEHARACFELALHVQHPKLPARKRARVAGFLERMLRS